MVGFKTLVRSIRIIRWKVDFSNFVVTKTLTRIYLVPERKCFLFAKIELLRVVVNELRLGESTSLQGVHCHFML